MARAGSPAGLLYASQTLRQLIRLSSERGRLPCLTISDAPVFRMRGIYIEGGQERFGRIVSKEYLLEQIRRLAEFKMNVLVIECYNLFPFASFPACADEGTLSLEDSEEIVKESRRWHVRLVPSLQTLAQAYELVWANEAGTPYREPTAPGLTCPSNPDLMPFIKGLYKDLLSWFGDSPILGIGCSEIDMQWQGRFCPRCQKRVAAGETTRDLLLGHAEKCIEAVRQVSLELGRPVRPLMWADEFYMYGPGKDWVGLDRIPKDTVMGYWKYWSDYAGIQGLLERGYDVFGISAMYNHTFYLADLSPEDPPKLWAPLEQTGVRNITGMVQEADLARRSVQGPEFWGVATASFSKHRLRAFDSIWYGFVLNGCTTWSHPDQPFPPLDPDGASMEFTRAFVRHFYDVQTDSAAEALLSAVVKLDRCKSKLELANQTLHDVVGVYDTQEPGYQGNTFRGACQNCKASLDAQGEPNEALVRIRESSQEVVSVAADMRDLIDRQRPEVGRRNELADLWLAAEKIAAHAERQLLMIDTERALCRAPGLQEDSARREMSGLRERWTSQCQRVMKIQSSCSPLYSRGDPCGFSALLSDMASIEAHLAHLAEARPIKDGPGAKGAPPLLEERFQSLNPGLWIVLGQPKLVDGCLETCAPGGWANTCGIATRQAFDLKEDHPLVIEFDLTPVKMGVDSQVFASANDLGEVSYRFSFYGPTNRFGVYTQSETVLDAHWTDNAAGWRLRSTSPEVATGTPYHIRAELTQRTWRILVRQPGQGPWDLPFWDSGEVPMDELKETRLLFGDVEPEGGTASSRWSAITVW